jgi:integron integrase
VSTKGVPGRTGPKLMEQLSRAVRARRYSPRTEEAYSAWVRRYVRFHDLRHPDQLGHEEVNQFLTHLVVDRKSSGATQAQARAALMFLYKEVLRRPLGPVGDPDEIVRGKKARKLPTVLTRKETGLVLREVQGVQGLVACVLYGSGLRLNEGLKLRLKDLDLERRELRVRDAKGGRERVSVIPSALIVRLQEQMERRRVLHDGDRVQDSGWAVLPGRYAKKSPHAGAELGWQFLFPSSIYSADPTTGALGRHHLHPTSVQRAVKQAARTLGMTKRVTCHTFRHSFATHLLEDGYDIRTIQELLGHRSVKTTMIYTHVLNRGGLGIRSPLDTIAETDS